jgi:hypothetical protein
MSATLSFVVAMIAGRSPMYPMCCLRASIELTMVDPCSPTSYLMEEPAGRYFFQNSLPRKAITDQTSV